MACDKRRANEDQARQSEYEEVLLPPYVFLSMPVLLITSTSYIFHPFSGHLTKKRVGGVLSLPVLFITSTSYISCFFGELTEFVSFKVLTDFLILIDRQDSEIVEFSPVLHAYPTNSNVGAPHDQQQAGSIFS